MINIDSRAFEKIISDFIDARDIRTLVHKFSKDRVFYYHVLKDVSKGKESRNFSILKKVASKKKVSEIFIIEQAKSVLSYIAPYDEPEIDNYYEILNVPPDATVAMIRERWIELMKSYHPDKVGESGLDKATKINEAYEVLSSTTKRIEYDTKNTRHIPIIVNEKKMGTPQRYFIYLLPFVFVITASYFYMSSSGLFFKTEQDKQIMATRIENPTLPDIKIKGEKVFSEINENHDEANIASTNEKAQSHNDYAEFKNSMDSNQSEPDNKKDGPEFVKIIEDDSSELGNSITEEYPDIEDTKISRSKDVTADFNSNIATPVLAVNDREIRRNELSPNMPVPDDDSLYKFVSKYVSAYKNRDLQTIRSLFAPNATENGVSIYKVLDTYKSNFSTLDIIKYEININRSRIDNYAGIIMGDFNVTFSNPANKVTKSSMGSITWLLRWRGHKWEIEEINYKIYDTNVIDR